MISFRNSSSKKSEKPNEIHKLKKPGFFSFLKTSPPLDFKIKSIKKFRRDLGKIEISKNKKGICP
jgi:hypothetical protein